MPFRVVRWGRFWALESLFAEPRTYLVAKGGPPLAVDDVVLAVPSHGDRRRVVEVLGRADDLAVVLRALLHARGVRQGFDAAVREEAAAVAARAARRDRGREDRTALFTFTIDPDTARDFDDAISVAREGEGYRAWVHIADVSSFVDADGAIEREARRRTASVYLPLFAEPMLPRELSNDVCSLVPRQERKCVTVEMTFDAGGRRTGARFYRSLIRSDHRLTYGFVDEVITPAATELMAVLEGAAGGPPPAGGAAAAAAAPGDLVAHLGGGAAAAGAAAGGPPAAVPDATTVVDETLRAHLLLAAELAARLRRRRLARGALTVGSFEPEYAFDHLGALLGAAARPETPSHALVEEFMLAANEAVAEFLVQRRARALFRVHEPPAPASVAEVFEAFAELGVPTPPLPAGDALPPEVLSRAYANLCASVAATARREERGRLAWSTLILRSLKQARYAPQNLGHFGLASSAYLHFTSPIRRYPDLVVHRALLHHLGAGGGEAGEAELAAAAEDCSVREREYARLEMEADDVALAFLLERRLHETGWEQPFTGEVVGLVPGGLFVRFGEVFQGYLPARRLGPERYLMTEHGTALVGEVTGARYRLGDPVEVLVERVDRLSGKVDLAPAAAPATRPAGRGRRPGRRPAGREPRRRPPRRGFRHR